MLAFVGGCKIAAQSMERNAKDGCLFLRVALRKERHDDSREHVATSCRPHSAIAPRAFVDLAFGSIDACRVAFEHENNVVFSSK